MSCGNDFGYFSANQNVVIHFPREGKCPPLGHACRHACSDELVRLQLVSSEAVFLPSGSGAVETTWQLWIRPRFVNTDWTRTGVGIEHVVGHSWYTVQCCCSPPCGTHINNTTDDYDEDTQHQHLVETVMLWHPRQMNLVILIPAPLHVSVFTHINNRYNLTV